MRGKKKATITERLDSYAKKKGIKVKFPKVLLDDIDLKVKGRGV